MVAVFNFFPDRTGIFMDSISFAAVTSTSTSEVSQVIYYYNGVEHPFNTTLSVNAADAAGSSNSEESPAVFHFSSSFPFGTPDSSFDSWVPLLSTTLAEEVFSFSIFGWLTMFSYAHGLSSSYMGYSRLFDAVVWNVFFF